MSKHFAGEGGKLKTRVPTECKQEEEKLLLTGGILWALNRAQGRPSVLIEWVWTVMRLSSAVSLAHQDDAAVSVSGNVLIALSRYLHISFTVYSPFSLNWLSPPRQVKKVVLHRLLLRLIGFYHPERHKKSQLAAYKGRGRTVPPSPFPFSSSSSTFVIIGAKPSTGAYLRLFIFSFHMNAHTCIIFRVLQFWILLALNTSSLVKCIKGHSAEW